MNIQFKEKKQIKKNLLIYGVEIMSIKLNF
jgi:hypothetical protein